MQNNAVRLPPEDLSICFGGGDFVRTGDVLFELFVTVGGLEPRERVLDVGCGVGRAARPLIGYLDQGTYEGFDTFPFGVDWCRENITPHHPNFRFRTLDIHNATYNPYAGTRASDLAFPYGDRAFDFVMLNSVFTHMLPEDVRAYLAEIHRVLDHGGRAFITWFLLDAPAREAMARGGTDPFFGHRFGPCSLAFPESPEDAVGYDEAFVHRLYDEAGLRITETVRGHWRGIEAPNHQDVVVARRG